MVGHRNVVPETENLKRDTRIQIEASILAVAELMPEWPLNKFLQLDCILETCHVSHVLIHREYEHHSPSSVQGS